MSRPPALTAANMASSRPRVSVRRCANVQYRLPHHATTVATTTDTAFAVSGSSSSRWPGPNRIPLKTARSTT